MNGPPLPGIVGYGGRIRGPDSRGAAHDDGDTACGAGSTACAFTAVGLVSTWGEVVPRWIPVLRGRRVPTLAAVIPGALGAAALTLLWTWMAVTMSLGLRIDGRPQAAAAPVSFGDWKGLVAVAAYAPLLVWGPLLAAVTISYWRRRRRA